jgi:predicted membrane-bound spermidine synthase
VIWFKRFAHAWGSSAIAAASVVASYLLGLGAGAAVIGRLADRVRSPLRWYGACEIGIAALALLVPPGILVLERIAAALHPFIEGHALAGATCRSVLTLIVIGPPCFLMGGTLPLLVKQLTPSGGSLREATGILYAMNTLGGAAGAWASGFVLLPALGLPATNLLAVAVSLLAGTGALIAARSFAARPPRGEGLAGVPPVLDAVLPVDSRKGAGLVFPAALLAGAASLALQIAWTRQLTLILGGSTYAFTAVLSVILAGLGLGGLLFHVFLRRARGLRRLQGWIVLGIILSVLAGQRLIEPLTVIVGSVGSLRAAPWWNAAVSAASSSALVFIPSLGMGILLPLYAAASGKRSGEAGTTAGRIYAWNTGGTILGALGAALVVLPARGTAGTVAIALAIYLLGAILLFPSEGLRSKLAMLVLALAGGLATALSARGPDPILTNMGLYLYGARSQDFLEDVKPLFFADGVSSSVLVTALEDGTVSLRVNGKIDASNGGDMPTQLGLAYLPRLFRPAARDVLVIGFGSGTTSGASLLFPGTRVTCAEIEPAVVDASRHFEEVNHRPLESPAFTLVHDDGRSHVRGARARYDLILSEPSNPWIAGVSNLFTREFYEAARERLLPGGVLAQWIQTYAFSPSDYAMVVRTIREVFPHGTLLRMPRSDTILLASDAPLEPTRESLDEADRLMASIPEIQADLARWFARADARSLLLERRILGEEGLRRLLDRDGGRAVHTDSNLRLEFDAPLRLFDRRVTWAAVQATILHAMHAPEIARAWDGWRAGPAQLPALRSLIDFVADGGEWGTAGELLEVGLGVAPDDAYLVAARFMSAMPGDLAAWDEGFSRILALSAEEAARVGVWLHLQKDHDRAVRAWRRLLELHPGAATLWMNLSLSLEARGDEKESRAAREEARRIDPFARVAPRAELGDGPRN